MIYPVMLSLALVLGTWLSLRTKSQFLVLALALSFQVLGPGRLGLESQVLVNITG